MALYRIVSGLSDGLDSSIPIGRGVNIMGSNNKFVSSENGIIPMTCNRDIAGGWEEFTLLDNGDGSISIRDLNGKYVSRGEVYMECNRDTIGGWERFWWINNQDGSFSLQGDNSLYVSSENGVGYMTCNRSEIGLWETFKWFPVSTAVPPRPTQGDDTPTISIPLPPVNTDSGGLPTPGIVTHPPTSIPITVTTIKANALPLIMLAGLAVIAIGGEGLLGERRKLAYMGGLGLLYYTMAKNKTA